jgi:hypothetical protein
MDGATAGFLLIGISHLAALIALVWMLLRNGDQSLDAGWFLGATAARSAAPARRRRTAAAGLPAEQRSHAHAGAPGRRAPVARTASRAQAWPRAAAGAARVTRSAGPRPSATRRTRP